MSAEKLTIIGLTELMKVILTIYRDFWVKLKIRYKKKKKNKKIKIIIILYQKNYFQILVNKLMHK